VRIVHGGPRWEMSRNQAFIALGLTGTGALHTVHLHGVVRIRRGGVRLLDRLPRHRQDRRP
jgi:hypothetical protein